MSLKNNTMRNIEGFSVISYIFELPFVLPEAVYLIILTGSSLLMIARHNYEGRGKLEDEERRVLRSTWHRRPCRPYEVADRTWTLLDFEGSGMQ